MSGYIGVQPVPQATQTRERFVATAGQTTFNTRGYETGFVDVYLNGVHLDQTDFDDSNGADIVLNVGAADSDIVEIVAFSTFELSSHIPITDIGVTVQSFDAATAKTDVAQTYTAAQRGSTETKAVSTDQTPDFDTYQNFIWTLSANINLINPTTESIGQSGFFVFIQDATGSRTVSLNSEYKTVGGLGLSLSTTPNAIDIVPYAVSASGSIIFGNPTLAVS